MELAMLRLLSKHLNPAAAPHSSHPHSHTQQQQQVLQAPKGRNKAVYLGPIKALVQERQADWQRRFGTLGLRCVQLTGDIDDANMEEELEGADIICSTPEKFGERIRLLAGIQVWLAGAASYTAGRVHTAVYNCRHTVCVGRTAQSHTFVLQAAESSCMAHHSPCRCLYMLLCCRPGDEDCF
jgi:hypothetical protein